MTPPAVMETETAETGTVEALDEEVDAMMEDEEAIDTQLDNLEAEEF